MGMENDFENENFNCDTSLSENISMNNKGEPMINYLYKICESLKNDLSIKQKQSIDVKRKPCFYQKATEEWEKCKKATKKIKKS